jgi:thiol-disulfide isomerase/thioredoxin
MNSNNYVWLGIAVVIIIVGGVLMFQNRPAGNEMASDTSGSQLPEIESADMNTAPEASQQSTTPTAEQASTAGTYQDYSPARVQSEQAQGKKVVLFFHADWCPYCRTADAAFKANLNQIPNDVTVLKLDYDSNTELRTQYGVTTQHTFVQIDSEGRQVAKWIGGDIDNLNKFIK